MSTSKKRRVEEEEGGDPPLLPPIPPEHVPPDQYTSYVIDYNIKSPEDKREVWRQYRQDEQERAEFFARHFLVPDHEIPCYISKVRVKESRSVYEWLHDMKKRVDELFLDRHTHEPLRGPKKHYDLHNLHSGKGFCFDHQPEVPPPGWGYDPSGNGLLATLVKDESVHDLLRDIIDYYFLDKLVKVFPFAASKRARKCAPKTFYEMYVKCLVKLKELKPYHKESW